MVGNYNGLFLLSELIRQRRVSLMYFFRLFLMMITFYGISHSTPLIRLYTTHPTLPHLSRYIALIPFYPTDPTLFHLSHSTSPIPLYPVSHSTPLSNFSQLIQLYSTYPIYPNTSCYYFTHITLNSNRPTLPHPFRSIQPILVYFTHPNLPHPIYKRQQKLKTRTKLQTQKNYKHEKNKNTLSNYIDSIY